MTNSNSENDLSRDFKGIWISKEIWLHKNLSIHAKFLWSEINSLYCEKHGGCFASDEYLIAFLDIKRSRLHEILKELVDAGLLVKVSFNGRRCIRKAIDPRSVCGQQVSGKPDSSCPENRTASVRKTGQPTYIENKDDNKEEKKKEKVAKATPIFVSFGSHVKLKQEDYDRFCQTEGKSITDSIIEDLNNYCAAHNRPYSCYRAAFQKFLKSQKQKTPEKFNKKNNPVVDVEQFEAFRYAFQKIRKEKWSDVIRLGIRLEDHVQYAEIGNDKLYYNSPDFPEKSKHCLRKVGLL